ncbi:MAG: HAMP domain-containing histidine kinase, partial [Clostridia bacterium]|nr:HAMP domain-containing histidine kinase [Clostridia bacterium]
SDTDGSTAKAFALMNEFTPSVELFEGYGNDFNALGYSLYVLLPAEGATIYGDFTQNPLLEELEEQESGHAKIYDVGDDVVIARKLDPYLMLAVRDASAQTPPSPRALLIWFLIIGGGAILLITPITYLFTLQLLKHIMRPLSALINAASRVESGDLSVPIEHEGSDEFKTVCDSFDHMQQHLRDEQDKNAAYEKARTDMISGISHDLRTPLTSVKGYIKGITDGIANTPEKQQRYLQTAYAKANQMDTLLENLFFYSKLETGNLPLNLRPIDLSDFVRNFVSDTSLDPNMQQVTLTAHFKERAHPVLADAEQLRRVFNNLTENAVKYAHADALAITISIERESGFEVITFADNGCGVTDDKLAHMFEQFWRGDSSRQSGKGSSGLGLYIVRHIIDTHGGSITAHNADGLHLVIRLPVHEQESPKEELL